MKTPSTWIYTQPHLSSATVDRIWRDYHFKAQKQMLMIVLEIFNSYAIPSTRLYHGIRLKYGTRQVRIGRTVYYVIHYAELPKNLKTYFRNHEGVRIYEDEKQ